MNPLWIVAGLLVAAGAAGTVVPALPGAPLVFAGLLLAAWIDGFQRVGWPTLLVLGALTAVSLLVDLVSTWFGAKKVGASRAAMLGAALGTLAGLFFGLPGLLLGPFLGAVAGELYARRDWRQAGKAGLGAWLGFVLGALAKLTLVFTMLAVFVTAYLL